MTPQSEYFDRSFKLWGAWPSSFYMPWEFVGLKEGSGMC